MFTSLVSVFLDSGSQGASSVDGKEISPKKTSQTMLKFENVSWKKDDFQPGGAGHHHLLN